MWTCHECGYGNFRQTKSFLLLSPIYIPRINSFDSFNSISIRKITKHKNHKTEIQFLFIPSSICKIFFFSFLCCCVFIHSLFLHLHCAVYIVKENIEKGLDTVFIKTKNDQDSNSKLNFKFEFQILNLGLNYQI